MKTLIELYDDRPIENVLASEVFRPERTVFLCPRDVARNTVLKQKLQKYFRHCGLDTEISLIDTDMYRSDKVAEQLRNIAAKYPACVVDITGGTDDALFACGAVCFASDMPAFTYSRRQNRFFNIHNAPFADSLPCTVKHTVEDCFLMAGGSLRTGRVDNAVLERYIDTFEPLFDIYLRFRTEWAHAVQYFQAVSQPDRKGAEALHISAARSAKNGRSTVTAPIELLRALEDIGYLKNVSFDKDSVRFSFRDKQIRTWLRDIGSVLELYVYRVCTGIDEFNDVMTSAIVDWEGTSKSDSVTNEIDVMAMNGILPVFISCKTCTVTTEALNELAILRDRFGGKSAGAAIVTTQPCGTLSRHRAAELGITVVDLSDMKSGLLRTRILRMLKRD